METTGIDATVRGEGEPPKKELVENKEEEPTEPENKEEEPTEPLKQTWFRVMREVDGINGWFYLGALSGMAAGGLAALFALFFGFMVDIFSGDNVRANSWKILALFLSMGSGFGIATFMQFYSFVRVSGRVSAHMRIEYYKALMKMEKSYFDQESTGGLALKLTSQAKLMEVGLSSQFGQSFSFFGMGLGGFIIAFYESWLFTLILMALFPVIVIGGGISGKIISNMSKEGMDMYVDASARSQEIIAGIRTVKSLNAEPAEKTLYDKLIAVGWPLMQMKGNKVGAAMGAMQFINMGFFYGTGMYFGAKQVAAGEFSSGEVLAAFFGIFMGGFGIGNLITTFPDVTSALVAIQQLYGTIDRVPKIRGPDDFAKPIEMEISGGIVISDLTFAYPSRPDVNVLQDIKIEIKPGQTVAFVGPSGCGKSTIISLLERFYDPQCGQIMVDGIPIWNLDIKNWRSQIGYVGQEPVLFDGTISENILLGTNDKYGMEDVKRAALQANAHAFIEEFPDKYDTKVGEGGGQLSGGQKQRISIARALVRQPRILLLDEATSALDTESEKIVQEALDKIISQGKRTCIVIAHRLSTIIDADMIIVFQRGNVVQQGSYDELKSNKSGVFYAMLKAQDVLGVDALKRREMSRGISEPSSPGSPSIRS